MTTDLQNSLNNIDNKISNEIEELFTKLLNKGITLEQITKFYNNNNLLDTKNETKNNKTELISIYTEEAEDHLEEFGEDKRKRIYQSIVDLNNKCIWSKIDAGTRYRYCFETLKNKILNLKIDKTLKKEIIELQKKYKNWY
jgi:DNA-binding transcriptional MerR regulator